MAPSASSPPSAITALRAGASLQYLRMASSAAKKPTSAVRSNRLRTRMSIATWARASQASTVFWWVSVPRWVTSWEARVSNASRVLLRLVPSSPRCESRARLSHALLSHLGDDGTNLSSTREAFETLASQLVTHLGTETHQKTVLACE